MMVSLQPMSQSEYDLWISKSLKTYCEENQKAGMSVSEALKKSEDDFSRLLPKGLQTPEQFLKSIYYEDKHAGTLWYGLRGPKDNQKVFIYDIIVDETYRGRGVGKEAMILLERDVVQLGLSHIGLHVFGHNHTARKLYKSLGYEETNVNMEKKIL